VDVEVGEVTALPARGHLVTLVGGTDRSRGPTRPGLGPIRANVEQIVRLFDLIRSTFTTTPARVEAHVAAGADVTPGLPPARMRG